MQKQRGTGMFYKLKTKRINTDFRKIYMIASLYIHIHLQSIHTYILTVKLFTFIDNK